MFYGYIEDTAYLKDSLYLLLKKVIIYKESSLL